MEIRIHGTSDLSYVLTVLLIDEEFWRATACLYVTV